MSTVQQFFPNYPGNWYTDPSQLPKVIGDGVGRFDLRQAVSTKKNDNETAFYDSVDNFGAHIEDVTTAVWNTIVNLSGFGGFMGWAMTQLVATSSNAELRFTVDGVETTVTYAVSAAGSRLVVGSFCPRNVSLGTNTYNTDYEEFQAWDGFDDNTLNAAYQNAGIYLRTQPMELPHPYEALTRGYPVLRFNSSLKVECRGTNSSVTDCADWAAVTYIKDL